MKLLKYFLPICIIISACTDEEPEVKDLIEGVTASPDEIQADGNTIVTITALLNDDLDKRAFVFGTDQGSFVETDKGITTDKGNTITVTAEKIKDKLTAVAKLKAPVSPGTINITVQPDILDEEGKYIFTKELNAVNSVPVSIDLFANAFSVHNNFDGEIIFTATLKNKDGSGVSKGHKVLIEDFDTNFSSIDGVFRSESLSTNSDSKVSAIYSPGQIDSNQNIFIVATILDGSGNKTALSDTLKIFITKKIE